MDGPYYMPSTGEYIGSYVELQRLYPNTSIPRNIDLPDIGVYILQYTDMPEYDENTQWIENGVPELGEDGRYHQVWIIRNFSDDGQ